MCQKVTCEKCGKVTWTGCGAHLDQVFKGVPENKRCECPREQPKSLWSALFGG